MQLPLFPDLAPPPPTPVWPSTHLRVVRVGENPSQAVNQPALATAYWHQHVRAHPFFDAMKEHLAVLLLNTRQYATGWNLVSVGTLNESHAHPREIFRPAIAAAAYGLVLMHNHPSGDPAPSDADRRITKRIEEAGTLLGIRVVDHVIVGDGRHFSFRESGLL